MSAEIVQFPRQPRPSSETEGEQRLHLALQGLEAALACQRAAVADWRKALANLSVVMSGLGDSMRRYRGSLDSLGARVAVLHGQAQLLERTADAAIVSRG